MPDTDVELMLRCRKGDRSAFAELIRRYEIPLIGFIFRMVGDSSLAEDLFQETFLRVLKSAKRYEPKAAFSTWLYRIARNLCIDRFKKGGGQGMVPLDDSGEDGEGGRREPISHAPTPLESAVEAEDAKIMRGALMQLSEKKREVLMMRIYLKMPYSEIAEAVDAPLGTVKYRIHDALKDLAEIIGPPPG